MCDKPTKPLDWDKPLQTTDGRDAVLLTKEFKFGSTFYHLVMISTTLGQSHLHLYHRDGLGYHADTPSLRNKTRKVVKWYNLYRSGPGGVFYTTHQDAANRSNPALDLLEIRSIEIEEPL